MGWSLLSNTDYLDNPSFSNYWSLVHFFSGVTAYVIYFNVFPWIGSPWTAFWIWFFLHLIYELKDIHNTYAVKILTNAQEQNTWFNSIGDQFFASLGFVAAMYLGWSDWRLILLTFVVVLIGIEITMKP